MTVHAKTGSIHASSSVTTSVAVGARMLIHWTDIAIEQERLAWLARNALAREVDEAKAIGKGLELTQELHPSLVAIAATSHALDALYGEIRDAALPKPVAAKWKQDPRSGPSRPRKLHEALKHGFQISAQQWRGDLEQLFELRDGAVHPELVFGPSAPHPLGVNTAPEYVAYRCERATEAIDLLFALLETCASSPKPALESWAADLRPSLERLKDKRSKTG
jgi:hypothetical protein